MSWILKMKKSSPGKEEHEDPISMKLKGKVISFKYRKRNQIPKITTLRMLLYIYILKLIAESKFILIAMASDE